MTETDLHHSIKQVLAAVEGRRSIPLSAEERDLLAELTTRLACQAPLTGPTPNESNHGRRERVAQIYFDYALSGIIETDASRRILGANPAATSITGRDHKQLLTMQIEALFDNLPTQPPEAHFSLLLEQGISHSEMLMPAPNGAVLNIEISSIQVDDDLFMHVVDDVTEDRKKSDELREARKVAEAANRAKGEFLSHVSHEIRTPMNGIIGLTQLTLMTELTIQQRDYLDKIAQSSKTLLNMLNDLLDFAKIDSGKLDFEQETVDVYAVLDELATVAAHSAINKNIELVFRIDRHTPRFILGDRQRLTQILINLISNAIKFTDRGHVVLAVSAESADTDGRFIHFSVSDTGTGISDETLNRLFQPFAQADAATTRRYGGTGLGLVIAQQMARGMGGELSVRSVLGEGSSFTLVHPLVQQNSTAPALEAPVLIKNASPIAIESSRAMTRLALSDLAGILSCEVGTAQNAALCIHDLGASALSPLTLLAEHAGPLIFLADAAEAARYKPLIANQPTLQILTRPLTPLVLARAMQQILGSEASPESPSTQLSIPTEFCGATVAIAEDMAVNQQVIVDLLEKAGIRVCLAENGLALLEALAAEPLAPELIFMDIHMPEMDGFETSRKLRTQGYTGPIIALSAGVSSKEQSRCTEAGMSDFLPKPIDLDELWGVLTRWLKPRGSLQTPLTLAPGPLSSDERLLADAGIFLEDVMPRFLGDVSALWRAISAFLAQHGHDAVTLRTLLQAGRRNELGQLIHGLKGVSAMMGARKLEQLARALEDLPQQASPQDAEDLIDAVAASILKIEAAVGAHLTAGKHL